MKTLNRMILTAAAASLAFLPVAAQANTRASDSGAMYSTSAPGIGRESDGESLAGGIGLLGLISLAAIIAGLLVASDVIGDDENDASAGT